MHLLVEANLAKEINSAASTSSESTDHECPDALSAPSKDLLHVVHHRLFVLVGLQTAQYPPVPFRGQSERTCSRPREAGMETKCGDAATTHIGEELEIVERTTPSVESVEDRLPPSLSLVTVCELDVRVRQGIVGSGQLLEAYDWDVGGRAGP